MANKSDDKDLGEGNFLNRWTQRKADVREAELREQEIEQSANVDAQQVDALDGNAEGNQIDKPDGSELTEEDVEKLDANSDFTTFMKAAVSSEIRRMALKKLWALDPAYNVVDGLVEYGEDYSQLHINVGPIKSAYQVGKGYVVDDEEEVEESESEVAAVEDSNQPDDQSADDNDEVDLVETGVDETQQQNEFAELDVDGNEEEPSSIH